MEETRLEKFARLSGRGLSKALDALERKGVDVRKAVATPINRVPRREPPKPKAKD
jgi:predicted transcriptional regulator